MKKISLIVLFAVFLYGEQQTYQPTLAMTWNEGYRYCFAIGGKVVSSDDLEKMAREGKPYSGIFWTSDSIDLEGAYSFDFTIGLPIPDHKSKYYKILCVK